MSLINYPFQIGKLYNRQEDIHSRYGGSRQSGISPSADHPYIFIFSGEVGEQYGYQDGYDDEGVFHYTGEGQTGDMEFLRGNKAVRDHIQSRKDLHLFEHLGKGKQYKYLGQFSLIGYNYKTMPDREGQDRQGIVFQLINHDHENADIGQGIPFHNNTNTLKEKRTLAYSAVKTIKQSKSRESKQIYFERNKHIKEYVLARAGGICECCGEPAPFEKQDGSPYLEIHHIGKLADKGMDTPEKIAAITPNCHREIHYGKNGKEIDEKLSKHIVEKERLLNEDD